MELTNEEAQAAYDCLRDDMRDAYAKSSNDIAGAYLNWRRYSQAAYVSATHGNRYVQNYANEAAKAYGAYENAGPMPEGAILAKDSFTVKANGKVGVGPLFLMEKLAGGASPATNDWKYTLILPNGTTVGTTGGKGSGKVQFCADCHMATDSDSMWFLPQDLRVK